MGVTNGTAAGMGGWRPYLVLIPLMVAFNLVNILSAWDDRRNWPAWLPVLTELSSALTILLLAWLPALALSRAPLGRPWWRVAAVHLPMALLFSLLHTLGMATIRNLVSGHWGLDYRFHVTVPVLIYEARKDVMTYLVLVGVYLLFGHGRTAAPPAEQSGPPVPEEGPALFDIRDGAKLWRVAVSEILAVRSAGNYAEFLLQDGRALLMRATLTQLADALAVHGFMRTHRSWLVNPGRVRELAPEGSGDYGLVLTTGLRVPLSRRFPDALEMLRKGPPPRT